MSVSVAALVPVKARALCKTRLSGHLDPLQRLALVRSMLDHVIGVLQQNKSISRIVVLSPEQDGLEDSIELISDEGHDLNSSLTAALQYLRSQGEKKVLILPADLACLCNSDIDALMGAATGSDVVIAPSADSNGTNALLLPLEAHIELCFGANSFRTHLQKITAAGCDCSIVRTAGLGFDVDTADDLANAGQKIITSISGGRGRIL